MQIPGCLTERAGADLLLRDSSMQYESVNHNNRKLSAVRLLPRHHCVAFFSNLPPSSHLVGGCVTQTCRRRTAFVEANIGRQGHLDRNSLPPLPALSGRVLRFDKAVRVFAAAIRSSPSDSSSPRSLLLLG
jgi:hypothetical protein